LRSTSDRHVIDVDVVAEPATVARVLPYIEPGWREHLAMAGGTTSVSTAAQSYSLPAPPYRIPPRPSPEGALERVREALDAGGVEVAVLNAGPAQQISGLPNVVLAAEIARASNDWLAEDWLGADERFRGSIVVAPRDAEAAADEVRRLAEDSRMAQVALAFPPCLLGDRSLYPIYEAAQEAGLPVSLQAGGAYIGSNPGPTVTGFPTTLDEYRIDSAYLGVVHLASLVLQGVFQRFPTLRIVLAGFGVAWLPSVLWRLDRAYEQGSLDAAKVGRRPTDVVRERVRFTTRDLDAPSVADLLRVLPAEDVERLLVFSSGYPEEAATDVGALPAPAIDAVLFRNAASWFRLGAVPASTRV
jgi:uncharacterized protein